MIDRHLIHRGDILQLRAPKAGSCLVKVIKVNPKNVKVTKESGEVWNVSPFYLFPSSAEEAATFEVAEPGQAVVKGSVVQFKCGFPSGLFVVTATREAGHQIAKLGGDKGKYFPNVPQASLEVVNFELTGI